MYNPRKIALLLENSKYNIIQTNGQRIYGLRNCDITPPRGTELFIGKLPRHLYEDELIPLISNIAPIFQLRLMVDFAGQNRGYCFVRFFTREDADLVLKRLNNYQVLPSCFIGVYKSVDNTRLFIGGIPPDITIQELKEALEPRIDGIEEIIMYPSQFHPNRNRGYAFLEFNNHRAAAIARRRVPPGSWMLWGSVIRIDWADPLPEPDPEIMAKVTTLYVRNIPPRMTEANFERFIYDVLNPAVITKHNKRSDYAFVHFATRADAEEAHRILNSHVLCGQCLEVTWARPKFYCTKTQMVHPIYCLSLPAKQKWMARQQQLKNYEATSTADVESHYESSSHDDQDSEEFKRLPTMYVYSSSPNFKPSL